MTDRVPIEQWIERLESSSQAWPSIKATIVVRKTDSTQDAARRLNASPGTAIIAGWQFAGRGRLGRTWADTGEYGVAITIVTERARPERLAIVGAITAALAAEHIAERDVGIKWPNDIYIDHRKLAGILIEQVDSKALVGVGMNVHQQDWPDELAARAVSLAQLGINVDRIDVICSILRSFGLAIAMTDSQLQTEFAARDILRGTRVKFRCGHDIVIGEVMQIDPLRGLRIRDERGEKWLEAATTSVLTQDTALT